MYVNRAGHEITDDKHSKLSPKMKVKYSKVRGNVAEKETKKQATLKEANVSKEELKK